tara:strand:- start:35 stop:325 length:291 start_codon:yes stop_codon:yes gene_type:complete
MMIIKNSKNRQIPESKDYWRNDIDNVKRNNYAKLYHNKNKLPSYLNHLGSRDFMGKFTCSSEEKVLIMRIKSKRLQIYKKRKKVLNELLTKISTTI